MTSLLDLPDELLVAICSSRVLASEDLFRLALVCRRVHSIALHAFFALTVTGFGPESRSLTVHMATSGPDALSGLCVALFPLPPLEELFIVLPNVFSPIDIVYIGWNETKYLPAHLRKIEGFFTGLTGRLAPKAITLQLEEYRTDLWYGATEDARAEAAAHLQSCFNVALGTGCETLSVLNGGFYYQQPSSASGTGIVKRLRGIFRDRPSRDKSQSSIMRGTQPRMTSFDIGSNVLLAPEMVDWTLTVLRVSPITHLTISAMNLGPNLHRLQDLAAVRPGLTSFTLREAEIVPWFHRIPAALAAFTSLVHLTIASRDGHLGIPRQFDLSLPFLESLRAPPRFIVGLLSQNLKAGRRCQAPRLQAVYAFWVALTHGASATPSPQLEAGMESKYHAWTLAELVSQITKRLEWHHLRPQATIGIKTEGTLWQSNQLGQRAFTFQALPPEFQSVMRQVTKLEMTVFMHHGDLDFVEHWTRLFPAAKEAKIEVGDRAFRDSFENTAERLAKNLRRQRQLEKVEINGRHFDLISDSEND
uniref:F-box domain-containing protein n=1 Tax=Mycena chlorophos TaxID=658473 RepID=A0ABQ0L127_MYCCL|nr:predicted protein [Mycena chlorophos]